jgi:hypothetical protein
MCWAHLSTEEYRRGVAEVVEAEVVEGIESQAAQQRQLLDLPARGPAAVREQEPTGATHLADPLADRCLP